MVVPWSTSGAGPRAEPKAPAVGHVRRLRGLSDRARIETRQRSGCRTRVCPPPQTGVADRSGRRENHPGRSPAPPRHRQVRPPPRRHRRHRRQATLHFPDCLRLLPLCGFSRTRCAEGTAGYDTGEPDSCPVWCQALRISASMSCTAFGTESLSTRLPDSSMSTSSSMRMPMPCHASWTSSNAAGM